MTPTHSPKLQQVFKTLIQKTLTQENTEKNDNTKNVYISVDFAVCSEITLKYTHNLTPDTFLFYAA